MGNIRLETKAYQIFRSYKHVEFINCINNMVKYTYFVLVILIHVLSFTYFFDIC